MPKTIKKLLIFLISIGFPSLIHTRKSAAPISFLGWLKFRCGISKIYWPLHSTSLVTTPKNIKIGIGTAPGLSPGCYIQGLGKVIIGDYTIIAPNVGIISANHDIYNYRLHQVGSVTIGDYCWIGMNAVILPNVTIGDHTIVAAGAVVVKSFEEGYCIVAGNPAKIIKKLDPQKCVKYRHPHEYYGYIPKAQFSEFRRKTLHV
jgi:acetyltransferase-like isoleucine patch superfamily enzyme